MSLHLLLCCLFYRERICFVFPQRLSSIESYEIVTILDVPRDVVHFRFRINIGVDHQRDWIILLHCGCFYWTFINVKIVDLNIDSVTPNLSPSLIVTRDLLAIILNKHSGCYKLLCKFNFYLFYWSEVQGVLNCLFVNLSKSTIVKL